MPLNLKRGAQRTPCMATARPWSWPMPDQPELSRTRHSTPEWKAVRDDQVPDDVARLLASLPEWFGEPSANESSIEAARSMETWTVRDDAGTVVGVTLVEQHFPETAEIHLIVVDRSRHGQVIGSAMVRAVEADTVRRGAQLLEVKTLGPSRPNPEYEKTRHFYLRAGFLPLEETDLWGDVNPCLFMVKPLG